MSIDVNAEIVIKRPPNEVVSYAMDPANDPVWISGIIEADVLTEPPLAIGTQVKRVATFLGRRIVYVLEVVDHDPKSLLEMRSVKGPFPMRVSYEFQEAAGGTLARIRIRGEAGGFYKLAAPVMSRAVKRNITNDLETMKRPCWNRGREGPDEGTSYPPHRRRAEENRRGGPACPPLFRR